MTHKAGMAKWKLIAEANVTNLFWENAEEWIANKITQTNMLTLFVFGVEFEVFIIYMV